MEMNAYEQEHLSALRALAPECTVLLKRDGRFPLAQPGKVALYGSGARQTIKGGTGSGDVNSRFYYTAEAGLKEAGFIVTSESWLDAYDEVRAKAKKDFIADIKRQAREQHVMAIVLGMGAVMTEPAYELPLDAEGDTCVYVLGRISGEGNDRKPEAGDIKLSETEIRDILACSKKYENFMLVLNVGGMVDLTPVQEVGNILVLSQLGAVTGQVLADLLLGTSVPSGKLTTTWSAWEDYCTLGEFGQPDETRYNEGVYVGYRYFDSVGKKALYPFGFGMGYTDFSLGNVYALVDGTRVSVTVPVTNTGMLKGKEIVQAYVSSPWGKLDQPYQALAGFAKSKELAPGESQAVNLSFRMEDLASYDEESASYILEAGKYILRVGTSSVSTVPVMAITVAETIVVRKLTNVGGKPDFTDWKPEAPVAEALPELPEVPLDPKAFETIKWPEAHKASQKALDKAAAMTDEELAYLCNGAFVEGVKGIAGVIGSASQQVAGAAGESYGKTEGVPALVMADGPAGLRLIPQYVRDAKGVARGLGDALPAGMSDFMGGFTTFIMKLLQRKPKGTPGEQYCTAIPIGTALAQSWNLELVEACGDIVGREMEMFHVDLWLAPAFNIHRSVLCGRNFEYYSEDPLVSGLMGAAMTLGVQKHPGRGTTVKHFCCNNQEINRYVSNSLVSERALREIYTKGFRLCIALSQPWALMTSYNLLNGVHTSERSDLMNTMLREEWGYKGLIMTDWVIGMMNAKGKYRMAKSAPTIAAGNDVFMPGSTGDYKLLLSALKGESKEFTVTREQAVNCAAHLMDVAWAMKGSN